LSGHGGAAEAEWAYRRIGYHEAVTINQRNEPNHLNKNNKSQGGKMDKYVCTICGYVYDPEQGDPDNGVEAGTKFEDLPDDWECPVCGASKDDFEKEE